MMNMVGIALYNIVDRIFIGQGAGSLAICGLALTLPCISLLGTVGTLTGVGIITRISTAISLNNKALVNKILANAVFLNALLSIGLIIYSLCNLEMILLAFGGSRQTIPYAHSYLSILLPACLLSNLNFVFLSAIRASGFFRRSILITLIGLVVNIILTPIFIFGFQMGIEGAAIATAISMGISSLFIGIHIVLKQNIFTLSFSNFELHFPTLVNIVKIGMAAFIMNITAGMVNIIMNRYLENYGGDYAIGAYGIISSYSILIIMLLMGICQGMQPLLHYNYISGRFHLVDETLKLAVRSASLIACVGFIVGESCTPWLVKAFTSDIELQKISEQGLRLTFIALPLMGVQIIITSYFQSVRQARKAIILNISRQFLFLIPALGLFSRQWGLVGIWLAIPFADFMATLATTTVFLLRKKGTRSK